jgi:hypothetical protein
MVAVPGVATVAFTLEAEEVSVKPGTTVTVRDMIAVADTLPDFAVTVTGMVVMVAEALAVSVNLLVELVLAGLKAAVTPGGNPAMVRLAAPVKPFTGVTVMVLLPDVPCATLRLAGAAPNVMPGAPFTVRPMVTEVEDAPMVPVTVTVAVPAAAAGAAMNVTVLVVAVVAGLNDAAT